MIMRRRLATMQAAITQGDRLSSRAAAERQEWCRAMGGCALPACTFERDQVDAVFRRRLRRILWGSRQKQGLMAILAKCRARERALHEELIGMFKLGFRLDMPSSVLWLPGQDFGLVPLEDWSKLCATTQSQDQVDSPGAAFEQHSQDHQGCREEPILPIDFAGKACDQDTQDLTELPNDLTHLFPMGGVSVDTAAAAAGSEVSCCFSECDEMAQFGSSALGGQAPSGGQCYTNALQDATADAECACRCVGPRTLEPEDPQRAKSTCESTGQCPPVEDLVERRPANGLRIAGARALEATPCPPTFHLSPTWAPVSGPFSSPCASHGWAACCPGLLAEAWSSMSPGLLRLTRRTRPTTRLASPTA